MASVCMLKRLHYWFKILENKWNEGPGWKCFSVWGGGGLEDCCVFIWRTRVYKIIILPKTDSQKWKNIHSKYYIFVRHLQAKLTFYRPLALLSRELDLYIIPVIHFRTTLCFRIGAAYPSLLYTALIKRGYQKHDMVFWVIILSISMGSKIINWLTQHLFYIYLPTLLFV